MKPPKLENLHIDLHLIAFDHLIPVQEVSKALQLIHAKLPTGNRELHPRLKLKEMAFCLDFVRQLCILSNTTGANLLSLAEQAAEIMDSDKWIWNESETPG
jgi:hypothetical protein